MRLLVDGNGLACRLWWASPIDAPERFSEVVGRIARDHGAELVAIAWDSPPPTWRHELFPGYKPRRPPKPEALTLALRDCRGLAIDGVRHFSAQSFEADDIIATLARRTEDDVLILANDKDYAQLVDERVRLIDMAGAITNESAVEARWGVPPSNMLLLMSWMGDSTDGLPGVRGIGPKKAIPHALAEEMGDPLTYELAALANVPAELLEGG